MALRLEGESQSNSLIHAQVSAFWNAQAQAYLQPGSAGWIMWSLKMENGTGGFGIWSLEACYTGVRREPCANAPGPCPNAASVPVATKNLHGPSAKLTCIKSMPAEPSSLSLLSSPLPLLSFALFLCRVPW